MKKVIALLDLTPLTDKVLAQAIAVAKHISADLVLGHMAKNEKDKDSPELQKQMDELVAKATTEGVNATPFVWTGDLFRSTPDAIIKSGADMAILGTHGQHGLKQNLFGSNIWKLVSAIPCSTLVLSEKSEVVTSGFDKVLLPTGPHPEFLDKVKRCEMLMKPEGQLVLFAIEKPGVSLSSGMLNTIKQTQDYLDRRKVNHAFIEKEAEGYSVGYSRDTLKYAAQENFGLIAIMTRVSDEFAHFGKIDKENLVLNDFGIPILCAR